MFKGSEHDPRRMAQSGEHGASAAPTARRAVILTALPLEYQAVRAHLRDLREEKHPRHTIYEIGRWGAEGEIWDVLIVESGAGNPAAAVEAERALTYFEP